MQVIKAIGFDIAKSIFQVHGVDAEGLLFGVQTIPSGVMSDNSLNLNNRSTGIDGTVT